MVQTLVQLSSARDKTAIVGIGETEYSRNSGRSELTMALEAIRKAVDDAGLTIKDIDGIMRYGFDTSGDEPWIATNLGVPNLTFWGTAGQGGSASCALVAHAVAAILAGMASCVVCYRSLNGYSEQRYGTALAQKPGRVGVGTGWEPLHEAFQLPYGLVTPAHSYALAATRHMHEYGTTAKQLGAIAMACRKHALRNPNALMYGRPLTMDEYLNGRMIADPLRLFDCAIEADGACAVVVTSAERARDLRQSPVYISAATQGSGPMPGNEGISWVFKPVITETPAKWLAPRLFRAADMEPANIDVAEFYDCFTISVLMQIEDYGFCKKGEGGAFSEGGRLELGGDLPINTSGGHLSEAYIHGLNHVVEGVKQMRGTSMAQVPGARAALVTAGVPTATSALILTR